MTTTWIVGGIAAACLAVALAIWRLRKASATVQHILDEERAETERRQANPEPPDTPVRRSRRIDR